MAARTSTALVLIAALVAVVWAASSPFETTLQQALDSKVPTTNKRHSLTHSLVRSCQLTHGCWWKRRAGH